MKNGLSTVAISGLLALGVTTLVTKANASALAVSASTSKLAEDVSQSSDKVVQVNHRRHHHHWRGHMGPGPVVPPWMRHHHHHHLHYHYHHHHDHWGPGPSFFLQFGAPPVPDYMGPVYRSPGPVMPPNHVRWCKETYRSYRASDNTYQPYHGPRRQCVSPYYP